MIRDEMAQLLLDNTVLIHNLLIADAKNMRTNAEKTTNSEVAGALRDYAQFREELAAQIETYQRRRDAEVISGLTKENLKRMMKNPAYWRDQDPATVEKVHTAFRLLYLSEDK